MDRLCANWFWTGLYIDGSIVASALTSQSVALILKRLATEVWGEELAEFISGHSR